MVKLPLFLLLSVIFGGALVIFLTDNSNGSFAAAVYRTLSLTTFSDWNSFLQSDKIMRVLFFIIPLLGLTGGIGLVREIIASSLSMKKRSQEWEVSLASFTKNPIIVGGLGKIGSQVIHSLILKGYQWNIVVIHDNPNQTAVSEIRELGIPIIIGDMTNQLTLLQANVRNASTIILATENDEVHFKAIITINEIIKESSCPNVIFNIFDFRVAELFFDFNFNIIKGLKLLPVNLSKELANSICEIIRENNVSPMAKYALCGLGRVGYKVVKALVIDEDGKNKDLKVPLKNITVIDNNFRENVFISRDPIMNLPKENLIEMDVVDFYCYSEDKYDVCIITTGDDLSNLIFGSKSKLESLNIVRTRKGLLNLEDKTPSPPNLNNQQTIWVNTTNTAANKIIHVFENECRIN